jgi:hypothetical protein
MERLKRLINTDKAADVLGVSCQKLNKMRVYGGGPHYIRIGSRVLYDERDLEKYVAQRRQHSTSQNGSKKGAA